MGRAFELTAACAAFVALTLAPSVSHGQPKPGQLPTLPSLDEKEAKGTAKPYAPDERSGHVYLRALSGLDVPFGNAHARAPLGDVASYGLAVGGSLGVGLSRHLELDGAGVYGLYQGACPSCSFGTVAASLGLTYHLVQGSALDPWIRLGVGYRNAAIGYDVEDAGRFRFTPAGDYHGVDAAKLSMGATFYPIASLGLGPFLGADVGAFAAGPTPAGLGARAYGFFQVGLRVELDPAKWFDSPGQASGQASTGGAHGLNSEATRTNSSGTPIAPTASGPSL